MSSVMRFDNWEDTEGSEVVSVSPSGINFGTNNVVGNFKNDFASFGSTVAITTGNSTPVKVAFDRALHASTNMSWSYASPNGLIPAYNWKHSKTGYYTLSYWIRTTSDVWMVASVCKNDSAANAVGTSSRTGSSGGYGSAFELIYKVDNLNDTFCLFHWGAGSAGSMAAFSGTPPSGFIPTPQDGGASPANGYFITFNITPLSSL